MPKSRVLFTAKDHCLGFPKGSAGIRSLVFGVLCLGLLSFCANSSFFVPYPSQIQGHKNNILNAQAATSVKSLSDKGSSGPNKILTALETARIAQFAQDYTSSKTYFENAFYLFEQADGKAKLDLSDGGSLLGSFALNDNALPYKAEAYERILAHHYQSFNYLALGDLQGALIEVRRANEEQVFALEQHHKELAEAEEEAEKEGISPDIENYEDLLHESLNAASKVKSSFQNPYTFYYSGIIREAAGETNGAYIDYKKALEIAPDNIFIQQDVVRLAKVLNLQEDLKQFSSLLTHDQGSAKAQNAFSSQPAQSAQEAELVIFFEEGFIPEKQEVGLPFSSFDKIYSIAFPAYLSPWRAGQSIRVSANDHYLGESQSLLDLHGTTAKALQEGSFKRLLRQMIRLTTKSRLQQQAIEQGGNAAFSQFLANAYTLVSERADLRSWLTLPNKVEVARFTLPAGSHTIHFQHANVAESIDLNLTAGQTHIIKIAHPGAQQSYVEQFSF